jgi:hypothetical protein
MKILGGGEVVMTEYLSSKEVKECIDKLSRLEPLSYTERLLAQLGLPQSSEPGVVSRFNMTRMIKLPSGESAQVTAQLHPETTALDFLSGVKVFQSGLGILIESDEEDIDPNCVVTHRSRPECLTSPKRALKRGDLVIELKMDIETLSADELMDLLLSSGTLESIDPTRVESDKPSQEDVTLSI